MTTGAYAVTVLAVALAAGVLFLLPENLAGPRWFTAVCISGVLGFIAGVMSKNTA